MKPTEKHISFLDPIRGLALLSVFLYHSVAATFGTFELGWTGFLHDLNVSRSFLAILPATLGWLGVAIFFVVSGFCIHLSHERSRQKGFQVFFLRRFFRIYPPYLLALCFFAFVFPPTRLDFSSHLHRAHTEFAYSLLTLSTHLLLVHSLVEFLSCSINGSFWSIAVEVQLYALYPLLLWVVSRLGWRGALLLTGIVEGVMRGMMGTTMAFLPSFDIPGWFALSPLIFWFSWAIGAALADAYLKGERLPFRTFPLWLWPMLTLGCYCVLPLYAFCFMLAALSSATFIAYLLAKPAPALPSLGAFGWLFKHLSWAGTVSYSAYLIHQPLVDLVPQLAGRFFPGVTLPALVLYGLCLLSWFPILGLSYLLYRWVELPSIAWGKGVIARRELSIKEVPLADAAAVEPS